VKTAEAAQKNLDFSTCQSLFYSLPDIERRSLFTPVKQVTNVCQATGKSYTRVYGAELGVDMKNRRDAEQALVQLYKDGLIREFTVLSQQYEGKADDKGRL